MRKLIYLFIMFVLVSGCASSSGIVRTGQDTYLIARTEERFDGSSNNVKATVLKQASRYCENCGKTIKVISTSQKDMIPFKSDATAEVQFMCLEVNDPRLKAVEFGAIQQSTQGIKTDIDNNFTLEAKLKTLNKLLSNGLITKNEFDEQKKKLLNEFTSKKN